MKFLAQWSYARTTSAVIKCRSLCAFVYLKISNEMHFITQMATPHSQLLSFHVSLWSGIHSSTVRSLLFNCLVFHIFSISVRRVREGLVYSKFRLFALNYSIWLCWLLLLSIPYPPHTVTAADFPTKRKYKNYYSNNKTYLLR